MKLTPEEREKYRKAYDDALLMGTLKWNGNRKNKESFERAINYWLNTIDSILEEKVKDVVGRHNARILNHFQLLGEDERITLIPAITKATEETLPNINK